MSDSLPISGGLSDESRDLVLEVAQAPAALPELSFSTESANPADSVVLSLDASASRLQVSWANGDSVDLDHSDLDRSVQDLAGSVPGLAASDPSASTPWDAQRVLQGSRGNDQFDVSGRVVPDQTDPAVTTFLASSGSDVYRGSAAIDRVVYSGLVADGLSGLYISDDPASLPLVAANLPPLLGDAFARDGLLVYKNPGAAGSELPQIDALAEVDILQLTAGADRLELSRPHSELAVDFGAGLDRAVLTSAGGQPDVELFFNLERLEWRPLDADGAPLVAPNLEPLQIGFDVHEALEDRTSRLLLDAYPPPDSALDALDWTLASFALPGDDPGPLPDWIRLIAEEPTPELVGDGRVVVYSQWVADPEYASTQWLEIHVQDLRPDGLGLIGLELNLNWTAAALDLNPAALDPRQIFDSKHLPLFQSTGSLTQADPATGREGLSGLAAAALPNARQGLPLGRMSADQPQTLFARLAFELQDPAQPPDLQLEVTLLPAAGGVAVSSEELLILDDTSPKVWLLEVSPDQPQVGGHAFTLSRRDGQVLEQRHVALAIRNVNDAPQAIPPVDLSAELLNPAVLQGAALDHNLTSLFRDQDNPQLQLTLVDAPPWLQLDPQSGRLSGIPANADVGVHTLTVQAEDRNGARAQQQVTLTVWNVNDAPEAGVEIAPPVLLQDQSFTYRLPDGAFLDPDLTLGLGEQLRFELDAPAWLAIDPATGTISGTPGPADVGTTRFVVRAIDASGAAVEQAVSISVANVNDAPFRTQALLDFLARQQPLLPGQAPPAADDPLALFNGATRQLDLRSWFGDPDLGFDPNESLQLELLIDEGQGTPIALDAQERPASLDWLQWDAEAGQLTLRPGPAEIGEHFLRITARDAEGRQAAALVPLLVRHQNTAPTLQWSPSEEVLAALVQAGVEAVTPLPSGSGVQLRLAQEQQLSVQLPTQLFADADLGIDPDEQLTIVLQGADALLAPATGTPALRFDPATLTLSGSTEGLGLDAIGGFHRWPLQLLATDRAGRSVSFELELTLQRSAPIPQLASLAGADLLWPEGAPIPLSDLVALQLPAVEGLQLDVWIEPPQLADQQLELFNAAGDAIELVASAEAGVGRHWRIQGSSAAVVAQLNELRLQPVLGARLDAPFELMITVQSELGSTGLRSERMHQSLQVQVDPQPSLPIWSSHTPEGPSDPLALTPLGEQLSASSVDPREQISYRISLPPERGDLLLTDAAGAVLGVLDGDAVLLTAAEWAGAVLRSRDGHPSPVAIGLQAMSRELSNNLTALTESLALQWLPSPILEQPAVAQLELPRELQRAGELSRLPLQLDWPEAARSAQLVVELPTGSSLSLAGVQIQPEPQLEGELARYVVALRAEANQPLPTRLELEIRSPDLFRGELEGMATLLTSVRELEAAFSGDAWLRDQAQALSIATEGQAFSWQVVQTARTPEFPAANDPALAALGFDPSTGALSIPIRRGATASGIRNPGEALTLAVSNIPSGYALAEKVGDSYQAVGATDVFGTLTLFSLPAAPLGADAATLERFEALNGGNLYLVALDGSSPSLEGASLNLQLTARVADQAEADSRSQAAERSLALTAFAAAPPQLAAAPKLVDPLILDLSGTGFLPLTALPADGGSLSFSMLPGAAAMPTAWLSAAANANGAAQAAFVVLNDATNDTEGNVTISSITELFSEYFQADGRQRSFASGSAALASLDSNADGQLNGADALWSSLQLWFDDGDARSEAGELRSLSATLQSIDLGSLTTLSQAPAWAAGNAVLRSLNAVGSADPSLIYPLYDVGLRVAPAGSAPLELQVQGPLQLEEAGEGVALQLSSAGSEAWLEDGRAALTLVRVSGMPAQALPTLGVQDARGDWLFTWADLEANGGRLELIPGVDWSGSANLQVLISQLQGDGRLLSSALTSVALDVEAVADAPVLWLRPASTLEDTPLALQQLVQTAALRDTDGSETLQFELHGLPAGAQVVRAAGATWVPVPPAQGVIRFGSADLPDLWFVPPTNQSGRISFDWHAVATEANGSSQVTVATAQIQVRAVADAPSPVLAAPSPPTLLEGGGVSFISLIQQPDATTGLRDADGSEQLRFEVQMPGAMRVVHAGNPSWAPLSVVDANGVRTVVVSAADLPQLQLVDRGLGPVDEVSLSVARISRELSNADQARSATTVLQLPVARNARPAVLELLSSLSLQEDSPGVALSSLVRATPAHAGDTLTYQLSAVSEALTLVDGQGVVQRPAPGQQVIRIASLEGYQLKPTAQRAGSFSLDLQVISTPPGTGAVATTASQRLAVSVAAVADLPSLQLVGDLAIPLQLQPNGWLDLAGLAPRLSSADVDGSEQLALIVGSLNAEGVEQALPEQTRVNGSATQLADGRWLIPQAQLSNLSLYFGELGEDLVLSLTPRSRDGASTLEGSRATLTVAANAVVRVPLLDVRGELQGLEDQLIPLFSELGGVIAAAPRGSGAGQTLELEVSGLPQGASLVQLQPGGQPITLNRNASGERTTSLRLPYSQWQAVHWQGPADQFGPMSFQVQAFSVGRSGVVQATELTTVQVRLTAVNDAPRLADAADLEPVQEGSLGSWDLRSRFSDIDHAAADLRITAVQAAGHQPLPAWLQLSADGVLSGIPTNADVGSLQLKVTATDPLGQAITSQFHLAVGDLNAAPRLDPTAPTRFELDLREVLPPIQLYGPNGVFSDEDTIHGDQLSFTISRDGQTWSAAVQDLAAIDAGVLTIRPNAKWTVGEQELQLRATDRSGASVIQRLQLQVNNVNDAPLVARPAAQRISEGLWRETVQVLESATDWQLNLQGLFSDADVADALVIEAPTGLPAWLNLSPEGVLSGEPTNTDVGVVQLEWKATDPAGARATYRLDLEVLNRNQAPQLRPNPELRSLEAVEERYSRLDLSTLFSDEDSIHGDALRYSVQVLRDGSTAAEQDPEWLGIAYRRPDPPDATGKVLIQPLFYLLNADGSQGERVAAEALGSLAVDSLLRVVIEANDDRAIDQRGVVGVDLDISWSPSLELVAGSTHISSELPLFNDVLVRGNGLRVQAGSAPDGLRIGGAVGDQAAEALLRFDVRLKDPQQTVLVNLTPGQGVNRDGLLDRAGKQLTAANSVIHSFASEAGADLEILAPANAAVGSYMLTITAVDQGGEQVVATLPLHIANTNDAPVLLAAAQKQLAELVQQAVNERGTAQITNLRLFADQDLIHSGAERDQLTVRMVSQDGGELKGLSFQGDSNGNISLTLAPSRGLTEVLSQTIRLEAEDRAGSKVQTDWFATVFKPLAEKTLLTVGTGNTLKILGDDEVSQVFRSPKNIAIDLQQVLDLNAIEVADPQGDEVVLKLRIAEQGASLGLLEGIDQSFATKALVNGSSEFAINLEQLHRVSGRDLGSLEGLQLYLPANKLGLLPQSLSQVPAAGVGIELWTETVVRGDLVRQSLVSTDSSEIWIRLDNAKPVFEKPPTLQLDDASFIGPGQVLYSLPSLFQDSDPGDVLSWRVEVPNVLKGLVEFDALASEVRLANGVASLASLPAGLHRLVISAKDSSGLVGDRSGVVSGSVQLMVVSAVQAASSRVNGLSMLTTLDSSDIEAIFSKPSVELTSDEREMVNIVSRLGVQAGLVPDFVQKLSEGSLAVLGAEVQGQALVVLDASRNGAVLSDPVLAQVGQEFLEGAKALLQSAGNLKAPIGEISFDLDTLGRDFGVLQIQVPEDVLIESLVKTNSGGDAFEFRSSFVVYEGDPEDFERWLRSLEYGIYGYGSGGYSPESVPVATLAGDSSVFPALPLDLRNVDGSGYLIDIDADGVADMISMLLVDQGWFDTRQDVVGLIGDPLIPVEILPAAPRSGLQSFANGGGSFASSAARPGEAEAASPSEEIAEAAPSNPASEVGGGDQNQNQSAQGDESGSDSVASVQTVQPVQSGGQDVRPSSASTSFNLLSQAAESSQASLSLQRSSGFSGPPLRGDQEIAETDASVEQDSQANPLPPSSSLDRQPLAALQNWLQARQRDAADLLDSLLEPILQQPGEASLTAVLAMLVGPVLTERVGTSISKSVRQPPRLQLTRRDPNFQGRWLMPRRDGKLQLIERDREGCRLETQQSPWQDQPDLTLLPGFDLQGRSLLSQALPLCRQPGLLVKHLQHLLHELHHTPDPEIHWQVWLDSTFALDRVPVAARNALDELKALVERAMHQDPALADVVMLSQLQDCSDQLGLSGLRATTAKPRSLPHRPHPSPMDPAI